MTVATTEKRGPRTGGGRWLRLGGGRVTRIVAPTLTVLAILVLVEAASRSGALSASFAPPSAVVLSLVGLLGAGSFWSALGVTLSGWAVAVVIAVVIGSVLGVLIGSFPVLQELVRPVMEFLRPVPSVALIPLVVLTVGTGIDSGIVLAVFAAFWQVIVSAIDGARSVDAVARDTARTYQFSALDRFRWVQLPAALPGIVTGLRLATSTALILVVTAEIIIGIPGLGQQINLARSATALDRMYAYIFLIGLLGVALNLAVAAIARVLMRNHPPTSAGVAR